MNQVTSLEHQQSARALKQNYAAYMEIKPLIPLGGYVAGADASVDKAVKMFPAIERFLRQEMREPASLELVQSRLQILFPCAKKGRTVTMRQIIDTLAQLQRLRDKSVKDKTVELAKQKQICAGYDNNIKALGYLVEKTSAGAAVSVESLKNVSGYKRHPAQGNRLAGAGKNAGQYQSHANAEKPHGGGVRRESSRPDAGRQTPRATRKRHGESAKKRWTTSPCQCWLRHKLAE
ncbi:Flagellar protein export ATPase [Escherichia coli]|uniref:Flagellar protein export ATPase n=1 Tax=Escherichia coli TaxID=562 RepID=A0A376L019_ECOLX|nr:Flagellar protein export ATPase [Escherichia coli]